MAVSSYLQRLHIIATVARSVPEVSREPSAVAFSPRRDEGHSLSDCVTQVWLSVAASCEAVLTNRCCSYLYSGRAYHSLRALPETISSLTLLLGQVNLVTTLFSEIVS